MIRVQITQPGAPSLYRIPFYEGVSAGEGLEVRICGCPPGKTADLSGWDRELFDLSYPAKGFFGGRLYWQWGIYLFDDMAAGDVLVINGNPRWLSNIKLFLQAKLRGVKVIWWGHGWSATSGRLTSWIRQRIMSVMDGVILYTDVELQRYLELGFVSEKLAALNNTIDERAVDSAVSQWSEAQLEEFQVQQGILGRDIVLFCGRIMEKANLHLLIQAAAQLEGQSPELLFVVIGDGEEMHQMQRLANDLGVESQFKWVGSLHGESELAPWFLSAKVFVYPGAVGLSLLHAFSYGLPALIHSHLERHMPEAVALNDGENGLTFKQKDPVDLANQLIAMLESPELLSQMSRQAFETAHATFSMKLMIQRFVGAVHRVSSK